MLITKLVNYGEKKFYNLAARKPHEPKPKKAVPKSEVPEKQEIPAMPVAETRPIEPLEVSPAVLFYK